MHDWPFLFHLEFKSIRAYRGPKRDIETRMNQMERRSQGAVSNKLRCAADVAAWLLNDKDISTSSHPDRKLGQFLAIAIPR
jgi:hypothetical protein